MHTEAYSPDELTFAYCYRVYARWHTCRRTAHGPLRQLHAALLQPRCERLGIHILELSADATEVLTQVSLHPTESVATAVGKLKAQTTKWLRAALALAQPQKLLGRGYFAATNGKSTAREVTAYLARQGAHHEYNQSM